jgi:hypothetical protein
VLIRLKISAIQAALRNYQISSMVREFPQCKHGLCPVSFQGNAFDETASLAGHRPVLASRINGALSISQAFYLA